ncbi:dTMP kinase [Desulfurobacterium atlanticum]|uniref:Thymidylate kinase n=1 Tax=Desulfurobacterium atlanticum TaxID=240169 RepID=A0A238ZTV9_9BACT|nr:dTMP kinase [Desulfurobacterium atlanticum]SNR86775.1 dTMP kinase [Desulfurobacterium atlanticum]
MFITFEGIEGSGKTTQAKLLYQWLIDSGKEALFTREPGGTPAAEEIREFILTEREEPFPENAELFLYMAARSFHVENFIKPALENGTTVISDRFSDATIAYQGFGRGIPVEKIEYLNSIATKGLKPNITFLIDIPVEEGLRRIKKRKLDRIEKEAVEFHQRVREGYLQIAKREPDRVVVIDGRKKVEEIFEIIKTTIERKADAV